MIADENGFALQYFAIRITGISYNILSCNINLKSFISQLLLYKNIQQKKSHLEPDPAKLSLDFEKP